MCKGPFLPVTKQKLTPLGVRLAPNVRLSRSRKVITAFTMSTIVKMSIKSLFSLGMARIQVSDLELDPMKHIDKERVEGLARGFKRGGCRNCDVAHAVPALVDPTHLNAALARANLSTSALLDGINTPILQFSEAERPHILYGDHRLRAVETLCRSERWWLVSLYDLGRSEIPHYMRLDANEEQTSQQKIGQASCS
jgi:hypothetical protein